MKRKGEGRKTKRILSLIMAFFISLSSLITSVFAQENQPTALSLDDVTITEFKIIDVANENKEIDYRTSDQPDYSDLKNDPTGFNNAIFEGQKNSRIKLQLSIEYNGQNPIKVGDTLTIPVKYGGTALNFASKPLFDMANNQIGTWEYKNSNVVVTFGGDYVKDNQITRVTASFETGEMENYLGTNGYSFVLGERAVVNGKLGKNDLIVPFEKRYVKSKVIGRTNTDLIKGVSSTTDKKITWAFGVRSDLVVEGKDVYYTPYLLENNGNYNPNAYTNIYLEDTFIDVVGEPVLGSIATYISGITDNGEVISGNYYTNMKASDVFQKINQEFMTKDEVKAILEQGQYCIYNNGDGTYTLMLKWWDMNDGNGLTYDKFPEIKNAGGVGNLLKTKHPDIFGNLKPETIERINNI